MFFLPNQVVRWIYLQLFTPAFQFFLRARLSKKIILVPRHSVLSARDFSMFESDIDYSLVADSWSESEIALSLRAYVSAQRLFRFIGECEIYCRWEMELKTFDVPELRNVRQDIRYLRKWVWQAEAYKLAPTTYHRRKAVRSIGRLRRALSLDAGGTVPSFEDQQRISLRFNEALFSSEPVHALTLELPEAIGEGFSHYLGWRLTAHEASEGFYLGIEPRALVGFLALLPDGRNVISELTTQIDELRRLTPFREASAAKVLEEYLVTRSVLRTLPSSSQEKIQATREWNIRLLQTLREIGPATIVAKVDANA